MCFSFVWTAIGGYKRSDTVESVDYKQATGVIITYLIENSKNKTMLKPALEWEQKYLPKNAEFLFSFYEEFV